MNDYGAAAHAKIAAAIEELNEAASAVDAAISVDGQDTDAAEKKLLIDGAIAELTKVDNRLKGDTAHYKDCIDGKSSTVNVLEEAIGGANIHIPPLRIPENGPLLVAFPHLTRVLTTAYLSAMIYATSICQELRKLKYKNSVPTIIYQDPGRAFDVYTGTIPEPGICKKPQIVQSIVNAYEGRRNGCWTMEFADKDDNQHVAIIVTCERGTLYIGNAFDGQLLVVNRGATKRCLYTLCTSNQGYVFPSVVFAINTTVTLHTLPTWSIRGMAILADGSALYLKSVSPIPLFGTNIPVACPPEPERITTINETGRVSAKWFVKEFIRMRSRKATKKRTTYFACKFTFAAPSDGSTVDHFAVLADGQLISQDNISILDHFKEDMNVGLFKLNITDFANGIVEGSCGGDLKLVNIEFINRRIKPDWMWTGGAKSAALVEILRKCYKGELAQDEEYRALIRASECHRCHCILHVKGSRIDVDGHVGEFVKVDENTIRIVQATNRQYSEKRGGINLRFSFDEDIISGTVSYTPEDRNLGNVSFHKIHEIYCLF